MIPVTTEQVAGGPAGGLPDDEVEVSVVMPCLDEARTVGSCVAKAVGAMERIGIRGEVVVADNGSVDESVRIAEANGARVVRVVRRGYGAALLVGIEAARGRYVIMGDSDDSYDFGAIDGFVAALRAGDDLVMGNRFRGGIRPGAMPWLHRYVGNPALSGLLNLFFSTPARDAHCGLRGFRKDAYQRLGLTSPGMEFASEMVVKASLAGQRISEIPVVLHPDGRGRPPHLRSFRDGWRHLRLLLALCPAWLYLAPAAALAAAGLVLAAVADRSGWTGPGAVVVMPTLCLLAYQAVWLWAFAVEHGRRARTVPAGPIAALILDRFSLERGLVTGSALTGLGIVVGLGALERGPGATGLIMAAVTSTAMGIETIFGSFFLGMIRMAFAAGAGDERPQARRCNDFDALAGPRTPSREVSS